MSKYDASVFDRDSRFLKDSFANPEKSRLFINVFIRDWLDMFLERIYGDPNKTVVANWVNLIAIKDSLGVDIVDASGNVMFTVPPIMGSMKPRVAVDGRHSIDNLMNTAVLENRTMPGAGDQMILNAKDAVITKYNVDDTDVWLNIFKICKVDLSKYGITSTKSETTKPVSDLSNFDE